MAEHSSVSILGMLVRIISFLILWFGCCQPTKTIPILDEKQVSEEGAPGPSYTGSSSPPLPNDEGAPGPSYTGSSSPPLPNDEGAPGPSYTGSSSPPLPNDEGAPGPSYTGNSSPLLPNDEVDGLQTVLDSLEVLPKAYITSSHCQNPLSYIRCDCSTGNVCHINKILMAGLRLSGSIDESMSNLTGLEILDLSNNEISGLIPDNLGDLRNLTTLDLSGNQLTGRIPQSLGKLQSLTMLFLSQNFLNGNIPPSVGNLSSLVYLDLWSNNLAGQIPPDLGNLSKLDYLALDENQLYGPLPPELGKLGNINYLWLTSNNFNGSLPDDYRNLTSLLTFAVGGNSLSGPIPKYFKDWVNLSKLVLLGNRFEVPLPQEIFSMANLQYLAVSDLTITFQHSSSLTIPDSANLPNIAYLILRSCSIAGSIPTNIGTWSWLTYLDLSFNNINRIPDSMKDLTNLKTVFLTRNMLEGKILGWINQAIKGDLAYNNFAQTDGKIDLSNLAPSNSTINFEPSRPPPEQMAKKFCNGSQSKYHSLFINSGGEEAIIDGNRYHSDNSTSNYYESPEGNWAYSCSGDFVGSSTANDYIKNVTCGISVSKENLYKDARLCPMSLTYYGFCLHNGSYTVQLHFAEIVYAKDEDHSSVGKRIFDVYIQGERKLQDFNIKEKAGGPNNNWNESFNTSVLNNQLEIHLFWAGKGSLYNVPTLNGPLISAISVTPNFEVGGDRKLSAWKIAVITVASILAPLLLLALLWRMGLIGDRELRESKVQLRGKPYSVKQIIDATRKFSPEMEIGRERFGIVYKAVLPDIVVAVKKLSPQSKQVIDQIRSEPQSKQVIDQIRSEVDAQKEKLSPQSKQIIDQIRSEVDAQKEKLSPQSKQVIDQIIDQSEVDVQKEKLSPQSKQVIDQIRSEIDAQKEYRHENLVELLDGYSKKDLRLMIYEYMEHRLDPKTIELSWEDRCDICLGMAEGLKYLHERTPMVIHGSIKPSNILLDILPDGHLKANKISDIPYTFIGKEGPNVYTAPEHATRADHITDKVDVYSFGLVLLELISGKKSEAENLADWACSNLQEFVDNKLEFVDNKLPRTFNPEQAKNILKLAVKCVNISPALRPTMSEVVNQLRCNAPILHNLRIGD